MNDREFAAASIAALRADHAVRFPTPLRRLPLHPDVEVHAKDETGFPGGVKYRSVRDLFVHDIASGTVTAGTPLIEASAGGAAIASAHFARLLGLPLTVLVPARTSPAQRERITSYGAEIVGVERPAAMYDEARELAAARGAHYLDHLGRAADTADFRGAGLVSELLGALPEPPRWIVAGAGTGTTATTIARGLRLRGVTGTGVAVVDPENSAYFPAWTLDTADYGTGMPSRIPGIGRPRVEPGFRMSLVDLVIPVKDGASVAAMRWCHEKTGIRVGPSTGANLWGARELARRMRRDGEAGTIATLLNDADDGYEHTFYDHRWTSDHGLDTVPYEDWPA